MSFWHHPFTADPLIDTLSHTQLPSTRSDNINAIPSNVQGQPTSLANEPELIDSIAAQAQDATTAEGAEKFQSAAQKLEQAYQQDEEWLSKHPEHGERRM